MLKKISDHDINWKKTIIDDFIDSLNKKYSDTIVGEAYIGYPIFNDKYSNEIFRIDLALVTNIGFFVINFLNTEILNYDEIQDTIYTKMETKLKRFKFLLDKRDLFFKICTITYSKVKMSIIEGYPLVSEIEDLIECILSNKQEMNEEQLNRIVAGIQESYGLNNRFVRHGATPDSKGMLINKMNEYIEFHDVSQMNAVFEEPSGIQRIRGMAGSGKTIVLARKAVELHTLHPDWTIVVTYQTRSLKDQFTNLINKFYSNKNDGMLPNYEKLKIMQAWGSSTSNGLYYEICLNNEITPMSYREARLKFGSKHTFSKLCDEILENHKNLKKMYDCILIDEAQDFDKAFLKLCLNVLDSNERLVYAYDELQNLNELSMQDPTEIFNKHVQNDTPLKTCYRNQGNVIVTAHALGMGLYRDDGLLQLPSSSDVWESIGYVSKDKLQEGRKVVLYRTTETSPDILKAPSDDLLDFKKFDNMDNMNDELLSMINNNLLIDCLNCKDIMIIDMDAISYSDNCLRLISELKEKKYDFSIHKAGSTNPEDFFRDDSIVYSSIYRAKGNEAFFVYVINAQKCIGALSKLKERNSLFTAITRSKGWVRVFGIGEDMESLITEFNRIKENDFKLVFEHYPTKEEQEKILLNSKDIDEPDQAALDGARKVIGKLKDKIQPEEIIKELFGPEYEEIIKKMSKKEE